MVQFTQDGQGVWDFDYEALVALTSRKFADSISTSLLGKYVLDVVIKDSYGYVEVNIYGAFSFFIIRYLKESGYIMDSYLTYYDMQKHLDHAAKVGVELG